MREDGVEAGIAGERGLLPLESVGARTVVGVHEREHRALRHLDGCVSGRAVARVLLVDVAHALAVASRDRGAAVARAVVDDDQFERAIGLREDAFDRLPEVGGAVVDADEDADRLPGRRLMLCIRALRCGLGRIAAASV